MSEFPMAESRVTTHLREWDRNHVWHPFCAMDEYCSEPVPIIDRAEKFFLIDSDGRRYLDGVSSLWCNVHGHCVPQIDQAIRDQLDRIAHTTLLGLGSAPSIELARRLVEISPDGLNRVFYSDSGSTAVEVALKIAYQYHRQKKSGAEQRDTFLRMGMAYHGDTVGSVSVGGIPVFHQVYDSLLFKTVEIPPPVALHRPKSVSPDEYVQGCFDDLERLVRENRERAVAFVIEPLVQGAAGMLMHPPGYLARVRELTREYGIPLIADEVAVGFGRTGTMWACEQEDVAPDMLCTAKGITGGYLPLAATLTTDEIYGEFLGHPSEGRTFFHGHTYTGNPLACAAALASLDLFETEDVLSNVAAVSECLCENLRQLEDHPNVAEIRQRGLMVGIELVKNRETLEPFDPALRMGHRVTRAARALGLITRPLGDVLVMMPAPAMPVELAEELCRLMIASLDRALSDI